MPIVNINGISVNFPFEPYQVQTNYMEKVIECLEKKTNGILESPTGTGKTLSLLCSSLAWLTKQKAIYQAEMQIQLAENHKEQQPKGKIELLETMSEANNYRPGTWGLPKIIYASRTHSQLTQAMQELKRSAYNHVKAVALGGREQLCINPEVQKELGNANKTHLCQVKVQSKTCGFYHRVEKFKEQGASGLNMGSVLDIEDLVKFGEKNRCCSFYLSKELIQNCDILFMPYNYLLDPKARKANNIKLEDSIVILDEAHNVEKMCEESASITITSSEIALCIEDITVIMQMLNENNEIFTSNDNEQKDFSLEDLALLKEMALNFEKAVDDIPISFSTGGTTFTGSYIFEILQKANINHSNSNTVSALMDSLVQFLAQSQGTNKMFGRKGVGLMKMSDLLTIVFVCQEQDYKMKMERGYKVHVEIEDQKAKQKTKGGDGWLSKTVPSVKSNAKVLSYWCFNPGFGMDQLLGRKIRSIILTSGTLSPLQPLISELGLPVGARLENPHIIDRSQVCVKIVSQGPDKEPLISNYANRDNPKYIASLGRTILSFCPVIPAGLLIFFPSYPLLQKCQDAWQESGLWSQISRIKPIFVEPRTKEAFTTTMIDYYAKVNEPDGKGAIFMAVCRGKVSEGLDFADNNGRAVIITGLPFPPMKDPRVILKKKYLDDNRTKENKLLSGNDWYGLEATRAVNQAIGRVIRHKDDYGAILLCDGRFNYHSQKSQLSSWIQSHLASASNPNFGPIIGEVSRFFRNCEKNRPAPKPRPIPSELLEFDDSENKNDPNYQRSIQAAKKKLDEINKKVLKVEKANEIYSWKKPDFDSEEIRKFIKVKSEPTDFFGSLEKKVETIDFNSYGEDSQPSTSQSSQVKIHQRHINSSTEANKKRRFKIVASYDLTTELTADSQLNLKQEFDDEDDSGNLSLDSIPVTQEPDSKKFCLLDEFQGKPEKQGSQSSLEEDVQQILPENRIDILKLIKSTLSRDQYKIFLQALTEYQKFPDKFDNLFAALVTVFCHPKLEFILIGMRRFVKVSDKERFDEKLAAHNLSTEHNKM